MQGWVASMRTDACTALHQHTHHEHRDGQELRHAGHEHLSDDSQAVQVAEDLS